MEVEAELALSGGGTYRRDIKGQICLKDKYVPSGDTLIVHTHTHTYIYCTHTHTHTLINTTKNGKDIYVPKKGHICPGEKDIYVPAIVPSKKNTPQKSGKYMSQKRTYMSRR